MSDTDNGELRPSPLPLPEGMRSRHLPSINGLDMHVLEAGYETPGRPLLLLLHGFPELAYSWRKIMLPLAQAGYHVVAPDQRGYGRTTGWDPDYDGDLAAARRALGPGRILGASCYADFERARAAARAGADYVAFGTVFASPTKPHAVRADLALFGRCRDELGVPSCAIGGITRDNAAAVVAAGADLLAVISDIFQTDDAATIAARVRAYQPLFQGEPA